ncbi:general substrate transporter [Cryphonectria parasitica EP155]|uniref:General substrate transporter n=1 Tax=Cryphonectria parasitica (strain ATCC 38755 / EP155) TaxID=660469 RepID=A0A9P4XXC7_CRYP1|nr:general substrate transporter [Cryphonectria parasitica EP155]KAF3762659.1 general substrate transporter [Cryphonectria parasitica EP155]
MIQTNWFGSGFKLRVAITVACQMAFVLFGYDQGVFSGIVGNEDWLETFGYPGSALEGIIVSIYNLGAFSGCILAFIICEKTGRRLAMWIAMSFIIVGAALQASAFTIPHMMIARYITGIGTGIETSTVPMYQSELCEASKRGRLVSSEPLFVGVGIEIAYWFDYGMSFVLSPASVAWRLPIACQMIFAFVVIILVFGLPESPRYLYAMGRHDEALAVLCKVYEKPPDDPKIVKERQEILEVLNMEKGQGEYRWSQLFKRDEVQTGRRVLLAYGMQFMNQMGGINLVVYYITSVLQYNVGLSRNLSLLLGGVINAMFFIGSLFPTFFLDRYGRRKPMMWGSFGLGVCMMMIAILLSFQDQGGQIAKNTSSASVAFFFLYMLIFGGTANCIPWVYVPEILPLHVRAKGTAVGISSNWLWNFFVVMVTPTLLTNLKWKGYLIFMCLNFTFVPLVYFCYPETSNLTLEEIDWLFLEKHAVKTMGMWLR